MVRTNLWAQRAKQIGRSALLIAMALAGLGLSGCTGFWEEVSRKDKPFGERVKLAFTPRPNPMVVLRDSTDDNARAHALKQLHEPKSNGGSDKDQEAIFAILATAATEDKTAICRMAAIQSLAKFKDPRAVVALNKAYEVAAVKEIKKSPRGDQPVPWDQPEVVPVIQCQALTALGTTKNPAAIETLARVAQEPKVAFTVPEREKQQIGDVRLSAVRALGNFNNSQAAEALVLVMQKEKDAAMRASAREALAAATGKRVPDDPAALGKVVEDQKVQDARNSSGEASKIKLMGGIRKNEPEMLPDMGTK